jgi:formate hydrogenlyase subunit 3/multisubunit Na+/H+ antiporter MnhD subunit
MTQALNVIQHPLVLPIFFALLAGALAYVLARWSPLACKALALLAGVVVIVAGVFILQYPGLTLHRSWVQLAPSVSLDLDFASTTLGMLVLFGSAAFALLITLYSLQAMAGRQWEGKFYAYLTWVLAGACTVALADNLLVLLVGWELVTLMLFLLVNQGRANAKAGAAKAYGMLGFADACLLLAIALLIAQPGGSANLSLGAAAKSVADMGAAGYAIYLLILVAALAKAGAVPVHSWMPALAEDAPTPVMALLPAALDKLLGIYLLAVLALRMFSPDWTMQVVMMIVGAVTILAAVLMAMIQHNLKRLLAFHAVSQVGYMVLGIGTGTTIGVIGGLFHMVNNAIYKSNLFLMSGTVGRAAGSDEIEEMGGLGRLLPVTFLCGFVSAMAISGVPPLNGFASKWMVYQGALSVGSGGLATGLMVVAVFGSALTLASFVKVIYSAFLSPRPARLDAAKVREHPLRVVPMVVLALACIVLGLYPGLLTENVLTPGLQEAGVPSGGLGPATRIGLWQPGQATGLILIGILLGLLFVWVSTRGAKVRVVRPFLAGEVPHGPGPGRPYKGSGMPADRFRIPGTHFYETMGKLPIVGPLLKHGGRGAMDVYHWSAKHGQAFVEVLRGQHTGLISLYVAWVVIGLAVTLVYLLVSTGI